MTYHPALGNEQLIPQMRLNYVKGNLVLSRRWYLKEHLDGKSINRVLSMLGPEARALLERQIMPFSWYDFGRLIEVDLAILSLVMDGQIERMRDFGYALGRNDFGTVYRVFLALASPEFVLRKVTALGSLYFKESTLGFRAAAPGRGVTELVGRPMPKYMCQYGIIGWLTAVLEAASASDIHVDHPKCVHNGAERCEWACRWETARATA